MGLIITYAFIVILGLLLMNFCRIIADIVDFGEEINASILISIIMSVFIMFTIFKMIGEVTNVQRAAVLCCSCMFNGFLTLSDNCAGRFF